MRIVSLSLSLYRTEKKAADDAALSLSLQNSTNLKNFYSLQTKQIRLSHSPSNKEGMEVELPLCHLEVFFGPKIAGESPGDSTRPPQIGQMWPQHR